MKEIGIIIKHPFRDNDWRIDICTVPDEMNNSEIIKQVEREMLGPFQVIGITKRINKNRELNFVKSNDSEKRQTMKVKILFETFVEIDSEDYDEVKSLARAEADGMSRVLMANTNYNKFVVKDVSIDINSRIIELRQNATDMINALKNIDK